MHSKKKRVLYISPDGILEPLGDSQVLKYLEELSQDFIIELISFEKENDFRNLEKLNVIKARCVVNEILWSPKKYRQGILIYSQIVNICNFIFYPAWVMLKKKYNILHIRSYMPGLSVLFLSYFFNFKLIFDIRGFWADEKHDRLGWKKKSLKYRFFKRLEKYLFNRADAIVTLTKGAKEYVNNEFHISNDQIFVIRTCVDFKEFTLPEKIIVKPGLKVGYLGTIDTAYDFDKFLYFISGLKNYNPALEICMLTKSPLKQIKKYLEKNNLLDVKLTNHFLGRHELSQAINQFDLLAFCLKENFSIVASMPTKIGESLACGVPIVCNAFNQDIKDMIQSEGIGEIYDFIEPLSHDAYNSLLLKIKSPSMAKLCRDFSKKEFSLESAVLIYKKIYEGL